MPKNDATPPLRGLSRRGMLSGFGAMAATSAFATEVARAGQGGRRGPSRALDNHVTIERQRLDELAAAQHAIFNEKAALRPFDKALHGARFDVELYRITTNTRVPETGEKVRVSGLLALPVGAKGRIPVVSWQHGTILSFVQAPSNLTQLAAPGYVMRENVDSAETLLNVHRLAANGYALIAADYLGKGPYRGSRGEAYGVKEATVATCRDILEAALDAMRQMGLQPGPLFLNGWSQGALNTQWLRQDLQRRHRPVVATAVESPFNDLSEAFVFWAGRQSYAGPDAAVYPVVPGWASLGMIIALGSYETYYRIDNLLGAAIKPEFQALARKFWSDYSLEFDLRAPFPTPSTLLVDGFFDRYTAPQNSAFLRRLAANRATYWDYDAPVRFFYGLADEAIHPAMARRPLGAGGARVDGVAVKGASHRATFLASLYGSGDETEGRPDLLHWFNSFLTRP